MISKFKAPQKEYELKVDKFICNKFGLAEFLTRNFNKLKLNCKNVLDVGCGAFPLGIFLADNYNCNVTGIELNKIAYNCSLENIKKYKLEKQTMVENKNFIYFMNEEHKIEFDLIIANPPVDDSVSNQIIEKYAENNFEVLNDDSFSYLTNSWHSKNGKDLSDYIFEYAAKGLSPEGVVVLVFCEVDCKTPEYIYKKAESYGLRRKETIEGFITPASVGIENYQQEEIKTYIVKFGKE